MLRHYLIAALRNLSRNRLYAAINIIGLAVGFAAAILIALYVRDEVGYDRFLPNADRTFLFVNGSTEPGRHDSVYAIAPRQFAGWLKQDFPTIEKAARLNWNTTDVRHGDVEANEEHFYWGDPDIFSTSCNCPWSRATCETALDAARRHRHHPQNGAQIFRQGRADR